MLNFQSSADYENASEETRSAHLHLAIDQLLAKFGVSQNDDLDKLIEASKQMVAGLSERRKKQPGRNSLQWGGRMAGRVCAARY